MHPWLGKAYSVYTFNQKTEETSEFIHNDNDHRGDCTLYSTLHIPGKVLSPLVLFYLVLITMRGRY